MRRNQVLSAAFLVSLVLHLSAVTLFRIVILFPREDLAYFDVALVEAAPIAFEPGKRLATPTSTDTLAGLGTGEAGALPYVRLPEIEFPELEMWRSARKALDTRLRYRDAFEQQDSWSRLGKGLTALGQRLSGLGSTRPAESLDKPSPISRPAPGFAAYLEWLSGPVDRGVLSVVPIDALWGMDTAELVEPVSLVFKVDRDGRVTKVLAPLPDDTGIVGSATTALKAYRFEPIGADGPAEQHGTLLLQAEDIEE